MGGDDGRNATCGAAKPTFLSGSGRFPKAFFSEHVRPLALLGLIYDVLGVFAPVYRQEPVVENWYDEDEREEAAEEIQQHKKASAQSELRLQSTEYLASRFRHWIYNYHDPLRPELAWAPNDSAIDQFQPPALVGEGGLTDKSRSSRKRATDEDDS